MTALDPRQRLLYASTLLLKAKITDALSVNPIFDKVQLFFVTKSTLLLTVQDFVYSWQKI